MTDDESMITTECPNGHRVRGTPKFLGEQVRCPRCHEVFLFANPTSHPAPVIAVDGEGVSKDAGPADKAVVSDTSVMQILGDWTPPPPSSRVCPECGADAPEILTTCAVCGADLGAFGTTDSAPASVINTNQFEDVSIQTIMHPRDEIVIIDINQSIASLQELARSTMHTRYPVCDGSLDAPVGIAHIKDLLVAPVDSADFDLKSIVTPLERVPEKLPISGAFRHLQMTHQTMALVIDSSGVATGLVTMKDILAKMMGVES